MTSITGATQDLVETGVTAGDGYIEVTLVNAIVGNPITTKTPFIVHAVEGGFSFVLPALTVGNAYRFRFRKMPGLGTVYVQVPDQPTVDISDLLEDYQVDPASFAPAVSVPTIRDELDAHQVEIDGLDVRVTAFEDGGGGAVDSVNGQTGVVVLDAADVGADVSGAAAAAQAAAIAASVPTSRTVNGHALTSNVTVTASDVGLGNVNDTADSAKPVSTAQAAAIAAAVVPYTTTVKQTILDKIQAALRSKARISSGIALEANGTSYYLWQRLSPGQWHRITLTPRTNTNGGAVQHIYEYVVVSPGAAVIPAVGGTIVESGSFTTSGSYRYSVTAGNTMTYTAPASTTRLGIQSGRLTNGGLSKVSINGDGTRARMLPTAQDMVERGLYPATILTTGGGTLLATDRVLDHYISSGRTENLLIADDLPPAAHVLVITTTGYQRAASTGARSYVAGVFTGQAQVVGSASTTLYTLAQLDGGPGASATEYAISSRPIAGSFQFMGSVHDNESQQSLTVTMDGATPTLVSGVPQFPQSQAIITKASTLLHPTAGSCAAVTTQYILDREGLTLDIAVAWSQTMEINAAYAMLPLGGATQTAGSIPRPQFDRGDLSEWGGGPMRFVGDGANPYLGISKSPAAWMWTSTSRWLAGMWIEDILDFTNNWQLAAGNIYSNIQDRAGNVTKAYISRVGAVAALNYETVTPSTVWRWRAHYVFASMDSPEKVFAG